MEQEQETEYVIDIARFWPEEVSSEGAIPMPVARVRDFLLLRGIRLDVHTLHQAKNGTLKRAKIGTLVKLIETVRLLADNPELGFEDIISSIE